MVDEKIEQSVEMTGTNDTPTNKSQYIAEQMDMPKEKQKQLLRRNLQEARENKLKRGGIQPTDKNDGTPIKQTKFEKTMRAISEYKFKKESNPALDKIKKKEPEKELKEKRSRSFKQLLSKRLPSQPRRDLPIPKTSGRFYSPDSSWGQDDGQRRLGRFPIGKGYRANFAPIVSTDANNNPRSRLGMKRPPMMDLIR